MRKAHVLLIIGVWVTILPYLGFPYSWKDVLFTLSGLVIIYFSYTMYRKAKTKEVEKEVFDNFKENGHESLE